MDWKKLSDKASDALQQRGGIKSVSEDATELQEIAAGEGTLAEKAKRAMAAIKEPGRHAEATAAPAEAPANTSTTEEE